MVKKLRLTLLPILLLCLALAQTVCAASNPIMDDADLFSESEESSLLEQINDLKADTGMDYLVVTTDDAQGMSAQDYADTTYLNSDASEDTLLYLIDMDNREIYVYTEGMMIRYITDFRLEKILDAAFEEVADGNYYASARSVLENAGYYYEEGIPGNQHNYNEETGEVDHYNEPEEVETTADLLLFGFVVFALIGMVIGGIAALIKYFTTKRSYNLDYNTYEYPLSQKSELHLNVTEDRLIGQFVTHRIIEDDDDDDGCSTIHTASSGNEHGGGGRSF